jgi:hypothetical protein
VLFVPRLRKEEKLVAIIDDALVILAGLAGGGGLIGAIAAALVSIIGGLGTAGCGGLLAAGISVVVVGGAGAVSACGPCVSALLTYSVAKLLNPLCYIEVCCAMTAAT